MSTPWNKDETATLMAARACDEDTAAEDRDALAAAVLALIRVVFERAHRHPRDGLRQSSELTRLVRLMGRPQLFPAGTPVAARLAVLWTLLEHSRQRPVLTCAALIALDLELDYGWSADPGERAEALRLCETTRNPVMPLIALESHLRGESVAAARLEWQPFNERRLRLVELVDVLDAYPDAVAIQPLVDDTFEDIFGSVSGARKSILARRLIKELRRRRVLERHDRWTLLVNPLLLANRHDADLQAVVLNWLAALDLPRLTPYVRFYLETVPPGRMVAKLVTMAGECGVSVLPLLAPVKTHRGFWGRSAAAVAAEAAADKIIEREGLGQMQGGLALATDGTEGALSVADAQYGPLSVGTVPTVEGDGSRIRQQLIWGTVGLSGVGTAVWQFLL